MWTLKWGAKSGPRFGVRRIVFSFRGPQNGVQILGPILGSTLPVFFAAWRPKKSSPSRMLVSRFVCFTSTLQEQYGRHGSWFWSFIQIQSFGAWNLPGTLWRTGCQEYQDLRGVRLCLSLSAKFTRWKAVCWCVVRYSWGSTWRHVTSFQKVILWKPYISNPRPSHPFGIKGQSRTT